MAPTDVFVRRVARGKNLLGVPREKTLHVKAQKNIIFFAWIVKDNHRNASSFKLQSEMCFSQSACTWMPPLHHVVWHFSLPLTHAGFTFPFHIFCSKCKMFCSVLILHLVSQIGQYSARTGETQTPKASSGLPVCCVHSHHAADSHRGVLMQSTFDLHEMCKHLKRRQSKLTRTFSNVFHFAKTYD